MLLWKIILFNCSNVRLNDSSWSLKLESSFWWHLEWQKCFGLRPETEFFGRFRTNSKKVFPTKIKEGANERNWQTTLTIHLTVARLLVAQFVEQSLLTPEICSLNRVIGKLLYRTFVSVNCIEKTEKEKEAGNGPFKNNSTNCPFSAGFFAGNTLSRTWDKLTQILSIRL